MALMDDILTMVRQQIAISVPNDVFAGTVQDPGGTSGNPVSVLIDGSSVAIVPETDSLYVPVAGERVYVLRLGSDWVLVGKLIAIGGKFDTPKKPQGYACMYLEAASVAWGATFFQPNMVLDPKSDAGWTVQSNFFLVPPAGTSGMWKMSVAMRWQTSAASSATSYRYLEGLVQDVGSPTTLTRFAVAQNSGHVVSVEQDLHAASRGIDLADFGNPQFTMNFLSNQTGNTVFQQSWVSSGYLTSPATYLTVERIR